MPSNASRLVPTWLPLWWALHVAGLVCGVVATYFDPVWSLGFIGFGWVAGVGALVLYQDALARRLAAA